MWRGLLPSWLTSPQAPPQKPEAVTPTLAGKHASGNGHWYMYSSADGLHVIADRIDHHQAAELALALLKHTGVRLRLSAILRLANGLRAR